MRFTDRFAAGRALAQKLSAYAGHDDVLVLGLPRGGVPVAYEVAKALHAPLDVYVVRKLGVPGHEELALGAIGSHDTYHLNYDVIDALNITRREILRVVAREREELNRRDRAYRDGRPRPNIAGKTVILVDDGLATGASMFAAVASLRKEEPGRIVAAVPVGSAETCARLREVADEVVVCMTPEPFGGVGAWFEDFPQLTDDDVCALLGRAATPV